MVKIDQQEKSYASLFEKLEEKEETVRGLVKEVERF